MTTTPEMIEGRMQEHGGRTEEASLTALLRQLGTDSTSLIRSEIALAKLEAQAMARVAAMEGVKVGAALALAGVGALALVAALILALGDYIGDRYGTAAAIVGVVLVAIGGILARAGMAGFMSGRLKPEDTLRALEEDTRWARQQAQEFRSRVR